MYLLNKPYSDWFYKNQKKLLLLPYFQRTSGVTAARFFNRDAKVRAFMYSTNSFSKNFEEISKYQEKKKAKNLFVRRASVF